MKKTFKRDKNVEESIGVGVYHNDKKEEIIEKYKKIIEYLEYLKMARYNDDPLDISYNSINKFFIGKEINKIQNSLLKCRPKRLIPACGWGNLTTIIDEVTHEEYIVIYKTIIKIYENYSLDEKF